jgi:hypothetical protein
MKTEFTTSDAGNDPTNLLERDAILFSGVAQVKRGLSRAVAYASGSVKLGAGPVKVLPRNGKEDPGQQQPDAEKRAEYF